MLGISEQSQEAEPPEMGRGNEKETVLSHELKRSILYGLKTLVSKGEHSRVACAEESPMLRR